MLMKALTTRPPRLLTGSRELATGQGALAGRQKLISERVIEVAGEKIFALDARRR